MEQLFNIKAYIFDSDKSVYIVNTLNEDKSYIDIVKLHAKELNESIPKPKIVYKDLSKEESMRLEKRLINEYEAYCYNVLNKQKLKKEELKDITYHGYNR